LKLDITIYAGDYIESGTILDQCGKPYEASLLTWTGEIVSAYIENISKKTIVLVEQFRPPRQKMIIEKVGWMRDEWDTPEEAISKEIIEETGYNIEKIIHIQSWPKLSGLTNAFLHSFYAQVSWNPWEQTLESGEQSLIVHEVRNDYKSLIQFMSKMRADWKEVCPSVLESFWLQTFIRSLNKI